MIYHIKGYIVRKSWGFNPLRPKPKHHSLVTKTETIQGTLCYISAESAEEAHQKVAEKYPDFNIETADVVSDDEIITMLSKQNSLFHMAGK